MVKIQIRRDTAANWTSKNPILAAGEQGFESDTYKIKIGDGTTVWSTLSYLVTSTGGGGTVTDATATVKGVIQLAGDLSGTAAAPSVPALAGKEPIVTPGTINQFYRGDKTWQTLPVPTTISGSITENQVTNLTSDLASKLDTYYVYVTGLAADGVTDDSSVINGVLNGLLATVGTRPVEVVIAAVEGKSVYINSTIFIKSSYTKLRFVAPVIYGATGQIVIQGGYNEIPVGVTGRPYLTADAATGDTTVTLNDASLFTVGNSITLRTGRDANGNSAQKFSSIVTAINGNNVTFFDPLDSAYPAVNSGFADTHSYATKVLGSLITTSNLRGDRNILVGDSSAFTVGGLVQVLDNWNTSTPSGALEPTNFIHREFATVIAVPDSTHVVLSHGLSHVYDTAKSARILSLKPIVGSSVEGVRATFSAMQTGGYPIAIKQSQDCSIIDCQINGDPVNNWSWLAQAIRLQDSYNCVVDRCYVANPYVTNSGKGYGFTLYGATQCTIRNSRGSGCRHTYLFFNGAALNKIINCASENCANSDYDLHGAECQDNVMENILAIGGDKVTTDTVVNKAVVRIGNSEHSNGDHYNTVRNLTVQNYYGPSTVTNSTGSAIEFVPSSHDNAVIGGVVTNSNAGIRVTTIGANKTLSSVDNRVEGVTFMDVTTPAYIYGDTNSIIDGLVIERCRWIRPSNPFATFNYTKRVHFLNNVVTGTVFAAGTYAMTIANAANLRVEGNDFSGLARGLKFTNAPSAYITRNIFHGMSETTIVSDQGGNTNAYFGKSDVSGFTPVLNTGTASTNFVVELETTKTGTGTIGVMSVSPAFTGTPTVPTAAAGTNTTQAASTAFVTTAVSNVSNNSTLDGGTP